MKPGNHGRLIGWKRGKVDNGGLTEDLHGCAGRGKPGRRYEKR